jgi:protein-S-isoprenylcysteine O-methyltransferase Ste14
MVPLAVGFLVFDFGALVRGGGSGALHWLGTALVCVFYTLMIWCYLRRGPASATTRSVTAHVAAVAATLSAFTYPLLRAGAPGTGAQVAGSALVAAGTAWEVWALRSLGRNVSVIAQARRLADRGPYRWVRHPLYTGEIVSSLGLAVMAGSAAAVGVWAGFCVLQVYRAVREEQLLVASLPGYRDYQAHTSAVVPGLFSAHPARGGRTAGDSFRSLAANGVTERGALAPAAAAGPDQPAPAAAAGPGRPRNVPGRTRPRPPQPPAIR